MSVYRYIYAGPSQTGLQTSVPGGPAAGATAPALYFDVTVTSGSLLDLNDYMLTQGYTYVSTDPTTTPAQDAQAANIRFLERFINGPAEGWPSGVYREMTGGVFPTALTWWTTSGKTTKIVQATYTRDSLKRATSVVWVMYAANGTTVLATITDAITYSGAFETSRTRTIA